MGPVHKRSQLGIPEWRPVCKPNFETGSRDYPGLQSLPVTVTGNNQILFWIYLTCIFYQERLQQRLLLICS